MKERNSEEPWEVHASCQTCGKLVMLLDRGSTLVPSSTTKSVRSCQISQKTSSIVQYLLAYFLPYTQNNLLSRYREIDRHNSKMKGSIKTACFLSSIEELWRWAKKKKKKWCRGRSDSLKQIESNMTMPLLQWSKYRALYPNNSSKLCEINICSFPLIKATFAYLYFPFMSSGNN